MFFNRVDLKTNAKKILSKNYWWIVLVTLILGLVSGSSNGMNLNLNFGNRGSTGSIFSNFNGNSIDSDMINEFGDYSDSSTIFRGIYHSTYGGIYRMMEEMFSSPVIYIFGIVFLFVMAIILALQIFVLNPLQVGCRRWFLKNRTEKPKMDELVHIFSNGYANTIKTMFLKDLFTFLWSLLFIIPGIIKSYEYRMIPFLLAENPQMDYKEAFERSKNMMNGNKWDAFVLDLSFLGWNILAAFTCGILNIFYVRPYMELTNTELYVCLCSGGERYTQENRYDDTIQVENTEV